ncbi:hypothetical protein [Allochromatium palmeri]|uniref:hypothetical protein n=1 Tax=Allochromatium palmeri TaxID=231048 RepID=UPI001FECE4FA|nr:hypothetical protein [Allochromatium palmeri]
MPKFFYKAVKLDGETVEGELEAVDESAVIRHLQGEGLIPIEARTTKSLTAKLGQRRRRRLSQKEIGILTRELATCSKPV